MKRAWAVLVVVAAVAAGDGAVQAAAQEGPMAGGRAGEVSVGAAAFDDDSGDEDCRVAKGVYASYVPDPDAGDDDCDLVAGIQLPDRARLTSLACSLYDGHVANAMETHLLRVALATGELEYVFTTPGTTDSGFQVVGDGTPESGRDRVDNARYAYYVAAAFSNTDFRDIGTEMRVYGCTVTYR